MIIKKVAGGLFHVSDTSRIISKVGGTSHTVALGAKPAQAQIGIFNSGAGAVNRSMGGASTAAPIDASGALYWNPATISGLPGSSMDFGVEVLWPQTRLSSFLPANGISLGIPTTAQSGSDRGDNGTFVMPTMALVYKPDDSPFTYGFGVFSVGGFGVNYPRDLSNPILQPQAPLGTGVGPLYSNMQILEMTPTLSVQVTDRLSIGGGPTVTMATLAVDPLFLASPNANGQSPIGTHTRMSWGGGFQIGAFYKLDDGWNIGASFKSTQWLEDFRYQSASNTSAPRDISVRFDIPMIVSLGLGYTGIERWTFATDFRYVDYAHTGGFKQSGYTPTGAFAGLGFRSVFAMALGAQYQMTDALSVRAGYTYNQNPISDAQAYFNIASPVILEHTLYIGASYNITEAFSLSLGYMHGFQNSVDGPWVTTFGTVAGSSARSTVSADAVMLSATVRFGASN